MSGMPSHDAPEPDCADQDDAGPSDHPVSYVQLHGAHVDADGVIHSDAGDFLLPTGTRVVFKEHPWWGRVYEPWGRALHSWELASVLGQGLDPWGLAPGCEIRWSRKMKRVWVMLPEQAVRVAGEPSVALTRAAVQRELDAVAEAAIAEGVSQGQEIVKAAAAAQGKAVEKATRQVLGLAYREWAAPMVSMIAELQEQVIAIALEPDADDKALDRGVRVGEKVLDRLTGRAIQGIEVDRVGGASGSAAVQAAQAADRARSLDASGLPVEPDDGAVDAEWSEVDDDVEEFDVGPERGEVDDDAGGDAFGEGGLEVGGEDDDGMF